MILPKNKTERELILSLIFLFIFYSVIHNPIIQPKIKEDNNGLWKIEKMQHPLLFGVTGHNYLVLKNDKNEIVKELHGLATDSSSGGWKYVGSNKNDELKVWEFDGPRNYSKEKKYPGVKVSSGDKDSMENLWSKARECKNIINNKKINYPPYGITFNGLTTNSNSVAYTLIQCMGINSKRVGLIIPGDKINLIDF